MDKTEEISGVKKQSNCKTNNVKPDKVISEKEAQFLYLAKLLEYYREAETLLC
ncbi:MAG: hypothetical protein PHG95_01015 [Patescibacteria group bacterium]|nr:hypothetical protein [Patescibacteria group bacterium]